MTISPHNKHTGSLKITVALCHHCIACDRHSSNVVYVTDTREMTNYRHSVVVLTKHCHAYAQNVVKLSSSTLNKRPKACRLRYIVMTGKIRIDE